MVYLLSLILVFFVNLVKYFFKNIKLIINKVICKHIIDHVYSFGLEPTVSFLSSGLI